MSEKKFEAILDRMDKIVKENEPKHEHIKRMKGALAKAEKHFRKDKKK